MQWNDQRISQLFRGARRADEERVPSFERTLTLTRTEPRRPRLTMLAGVAALTVALALGGSLALRARMRANQAMAELEKPPALLQWRSPTTFLLENPGHELRDSLPQAGRALHIRTHQAAPTPQRR